MKEVPQPTIERLVIYYRYLEKLAEKDEEQVISSFKLGEGVGLTPAQIRKDLSYFGEFGCKGVGYDVNNLKRCLKKILGFNKYWEIVLIGAGNLGRALVNYQGFKRFGMNIVEVFDCDLNKIGNKVDGIKVKSTKILGKIIKERKIRLAIITTPADEAQQLAEELIRAGIKGIWNFAPVSLSLPDDVIVFSEDLASGMVSLIFRLKNLDSKEEF